MGEPIEIFTWPAKHLAGFYKITSSAMTFSLQLSSIQSVAAIGLACKPHGDNLRYSVFISHNKIKIAKDGELRTSVDVTVPPNESVSFWITWASDAIRLGRLREQPLIFWNRDDNKTLNYIIFGSMNGYGTHTHLKWRFELPPEIGEKETMRGGEPMWVSAEGQLPDESLIGGFENETLYIIRAPYRSSLTPGKFVPSEGVGYLAWGGEARLVNSFEVLVGHNCKWVKNIKSQLIPVKAVVGGFSEVDNEPLYVGRALHEDHWIPGKVQPSHKICYIPYKGREIAKSTYEILVECGPKKIVNSHYIIDKDFFSCNEPDESDDEDRDEDYENESDREQDDDDDDSENDHYAMAF